MVAWGPARNVNLAAMLLALVARGSASAGETEDTEALAKAAQNPIANMISLPFQNNMFFGVGPDEKTANVLNIQPVYPTSIGDWNIITRVPLIYVPDRRPDWRSFPVKIVRKASSASATLISRPICRRRRRES